MVVGCALEAPNTGGFGAAVGVGVAPGGDVGAVVGVALGLGVGDVPGVGDAPGVAVAEVPPGAAHAATGNGAVWSSVTPSLSTHTRSRQIGVGADFEPLAGTVLRDGEHSVIGVERAGGCGESGARVVGEGLDRQLDRGGRREDRVGCAECETREATNDRRAETDQRWHTPSLCAEHDISSDDAYRCAPL